MANIEEAKKYLETGGLGEVAGLADMEMQIGHPKVQLDTDLAIALCMLALEALNRRSAH